MAQGIQLQRVVRASGHLDRNRKLLCDTHKQVDNIRKPFSCLCPDKNAPIRRTYSLLSDVDVDRLLLGILDENADGHIAVVLVPLVSAVLKRQSRSSVIKSMAEIGGAFFFFWL